MKTREQNVRTAYMVMVSSCVVLLTVLVVAIVKYESAIALADEREQIIAALENDKVELSLKNVAVEADLAAAECRIVSLEKTVAEMDEQINVLREPPINAYDHLGWDFDYVVRVVGAEARGEPIDGILAVCECIANTAEDKGMTPEQVVMVPGQYTSPVSRSCTDGMETVNECCCRVFLNGERPHAERIKYFYAYKNGYSAWHEGKTLCYTIGGHKFFKD